MVKLPGLMYDYFLMQPVKNDWRHNYTIKKNQVQK